MKTSLLCNCKKTLTVIGFIVFFSFSNTIYGQFAFTEDFENELTPHLTLNSSFSETVSGTTINFNCSRRMQFHSQGTFGYLNSLKYLYIAQPSDSFTTTGIISLNTSANPGIGFKIDSFAAYVASDQGANNPFAGAVTISGTPIDGSGFVSATINIASAGALPIGQTRDGNGTVYAITTAGTSLNGKFFTSLTFSIFDPDGPGAGLGTRYFEIDHIKFTTSPAVTNQYAIGNVSIAEGNNGTSILSYNVTRSLNTSAGSVQIQSSNGTATAGSDYVALPLTTINFSAGGLLTQTVNVTINGDVTIEPNETFNMTLSNPVGGTISSSTGVVTILDDDEFAEIFDNEVHNALVFSQGGNNFTTTGKLVVKNGGTFGAGGSPGYAASSEPYATGNQGSFKITSPGKSFYITKVDLWAATVTGTGPNWTYTATNCTIAITGTKADGTGTLVFNAPITPTGTNGHTTVVIGAPLANIALSEISFSTPSGITYLQIDNFKFGINAVANTQLSINDVSVIEGTTGAGTTPMTFTVTRTNNTTAFNVNVTSSDITANAGTDYTAFNTTLSFTNGGALSQTVTVLINKDATVEPGETINMTLSGATNGTLYLKQVGIGTILNDDGQLGETFEDEVNNATTFSESAGTFTASGGFRVVNSGTFGSGSSNFYLASTANVTGNIGSITLTTPNSAFKLTALDAWVGTTGDMFAADSVMFTGSLLTGGTASVTKKITSTSNTGTGWQQNITFTGTALDNVFLTALQVTTKGVLKYCDIDNFKYNVFSALPVIELKDAANANIVNGAAASLTNNTDFGSTTCSNGGTIVKVFTIKNTGLTNLILSGSPLAILGGANANQFTVTVQPSATIAGAASATVTVRYNPNVVGTHNATLTFTSNDITNNPFVINLKGTATTAAGDPAVFGINTWNVYAWNAGGAAIAGNTNSWVTNYSGFYTNSNLNIQTDLIWPSNSSPSAAVNYQGCSVGVDNHSFSAKRLGFPCGLYQLDIPVHDDGVQLWLNGTKIFEHDGCCDVHTNVWTGFLGATDRIEFKITEGGGGSAGYLTFNTITLPAITTNNALTFDGTNDYVEAKSCTATPVINGGSAITVEYWFKGSSLQSAVRSQDGFGYMVAGWNGKHILSTDGATSGGVLVGAAATDGNWHHVAFTWQQGAVNGFKSYLDGVLVEQKNAANVALPIINNSLFLGSFNGGSEFMNGSLDEVRVWNIVRSQSQIQAGMSNFCNQFPLPQVGLLAYYKFDHGIANGSNGILSIANAANANDLQARLNNFAGTGATSNFTSGATQTVEWIGALDNNWANIANWACNQLPNANSTVIINAGRANYPNINVSGTIYKLILNTGASIRIPTPSTLTITGK